MSADAVERAGARTRVTATARLARVRLSEVAEQRAAAGARVWETPDILPWTAWLQRLWAECALTGELPLLLDTLQEACLWERVVEESGLAPPLSGASLAVEAARAWSRLQAWSLPLPAEADCATDEQRAFLHWARAFERQCRADGWLAAARLPAALGPRLDAVTLPAQLLLEGFDRLTPAEERLLQALAGQGVRIEHCRPGLVRATPARLTAADPEAERAAMAAWVSARLEAGCTRVLVVAPRLGEQRDALTRALDAQLAPGGDGRPLYSLSLGRPLTEAPLVDDALAWLDLSGPAPTWAEWSARLRSPFLPDAAPCTPGAARSGHAARAELDFRLRERGEWRLAWGTVIGAARRGGCAGLAAALERQQALRRGWPRRQSPSAWVAAWTALLSGPGPHAGQALGSAEHQTLEAWCALLEAFTRLDALLPALGPGEALALLRRHAAGRVFQPEAAETPVQLTGLLEAAGLQADALWLLDASDEVLPPPATPSPLLPLALQRRHGLPGASALEALELAASRVQGLRAAAGEMVCSHALADGDRPLRPSPLVASWPPTPLGDPALPPLALAWLGRAPMECIDDRQGPALPAGAAPGRGSALFAEQAACPFRAFARLRLGARSPAEPGVGLDARARGTLVHEALAAFWRAVRSRSHLLDLTPAGLERALAEAAAQALASPAARPLEGGPPGFRDLEHQRLCRLLGEWLVHERAREPFEVLACEAERRVDFAGLSLLLRLDRIDTLSGGGAAFIIDYKTGSPQPGQWSGERMEEPQLPLYAVTADTPPAALAFAVLRPGRMGYRGCGSGVAVAPGVQPLRAPPEADGAAAEPGEAAWSGLLAQWRRHLTVLAGDFARGEAPVDPRTAQVCRHCELQACCRIAERRGAAPAPDGDLPA